MNDPITRAEPLADQVYRYLRQEILSGNIEPGFRIVESKIAQQLSISRGPVREAIRRLEQEGLVTTVQGVTTLFKPSLRDFEDLYELRLAIEPMAARLAAKNITPEGCSRLEATLNQADESLAHGEMDAFIDNNTQFHDLVVEYCGNPRLQKVMHEVSSITRYYRNIVFKIYHRRVTTIDEHRQIYEAIRQGAAEEAHQRMMTHLEADLVFIRSILQQEGK